MADSTVARLGSIAERRWGLFTTAQAVAAGVSRKQLVRLTSSRVIERVAHGVYRMAGAPPQKHENIYATWLALGGATATRTKPGVPPLVAAGVTAAVVHEIGDFFLDGLDFVVPSRKGTRLADVRLRIRILEPDDVVSVDGLPALTVERTILDLIELGTDTSLVTDALRDAVRQGKITRVEHLRSGLAKLGKRYEGDAHRIATELDALITQTEGGDRV
ncbi:MAG: transcriptional regulator [Aeromicrobium sp.]|nr:MAG: transcriptional regulator [Aeromicrobium sp.]